MRIRLNIGKTVHENAAAYYEEAKEAKEKAAGVEAAIVETIKEIERAKREQNAAERKRNEETKVARKKEWYEKFHYFFTSGGKLAIGGRSADQNDLVYKTYFEEEDLFFHADIQGGAACILKAGKDAGEAELKEAAQFAACYSSAWKNGNAAVDVYCVRKGQVSKHAQGGFIAKGAFAIEGERTWFRKTPLKLQIGAGEGRVEVLPQCSAKKLARVVGLVPGNEEKGVVVRKIAKRLGVHPDEVQNALPAGRSGVVEREKL